MSKNKLKDIKTNYNKNMLENSLKEITINKHIMSRNNIENEINWNIARM